MSNPDQKAKHASRIHQKEVKVEKQRKIAKNYGIEEKEPHRFAKHHALNCGNPKCMMCSNPRKTFGELTPQEQRLFQDKFYQE